MNEAKHMQCRAEQRKAKQSRAAQRDEAQNSKTEAKDARLVIHNGYILLLHHSYDDKYVYLGCSKHSETNEAAQSKANQRKAEQSRAAQRDEAQNSKTEAKDARLVIHNGYLLLLHHSI
jgi:endonuclease IV